MIGAVVVAMNVDGPNSYKVISCSLYIRLIVILILIGLNQ